MCSSDLKAYKELVKEGWITRDRAARDLTGMKYSKAVQQLAGENKLLAEAHEPLIEAGLTEDQNPHILNKDEDDGDESNG